MLLLVSVALVLLSKLGASPSEERRPLPLPVKSVAARPPPARAPLMAPLWLVGLLGLCVCVT